MGKFMTCHNYRGKGYATFEGYLDQMNKGRNPGHAYVPRFRNVYRQETDFLRGYAIGMSANRQLDGNGELIGDALREKLLDPGYGLWGMAAWMQGPLHALCLDRVKVLCRSGWLNPDWVQTQWQRFESGRLNWPRAWVLVVLGEFASRESNSSL